MYRPPEEQQRASFEAAESLMPETGEPIPMLTIFNLSWSVCKVVLSQPRGSGFLFQLEVAGDEVSSIKTLYGVLTNHHVLDGVTLQHNKRLRLECHSPQYASTGTTLSHEFVLTPTVFRCTCPLLDFTFVELPTESKNFLEGRGCLFLRGTAVSHQGQQIFVLQHPRGKGIHFAPGFIRANWGTDVLHDASTQYGSSGSMMANVSGEVVGLHRARRPSESVNVGVKIEFVREAIGVLWRRHHRVLQQERAVPPPPFIKVQALTDDGNQTISDLGLMETKHPHVFERAERPDSVGITRMWFFRTAHAWFWTPSEPYQTGELGYLRECNWMRICPQTRATFHVVVGGDWHDQEPAECSYQKTETREQGKITVNGNPTSTGVRDGNGVTIPVGMNGSHTIHDRV